MFTLTATNSSGKSLQITQNSSYKLTAIDGLTSPTASINSSTIAGSDGSLFNSAKVESRNIVFTIFFEPPIEKNRINLYRFFHIKDLVSIRYTNGSRDVTIAGYVESLEGSLFEMRQSVQVSILCLQPYFKSAAEIVEELSQTLDSFEFPFSIDLTGIPFSEIDKTYMQNVYNNGDVSCGMIIELQATGTVVNPTIYDATNRTFMGLDKTLQAGDLVVINTNVGEKSIVLKSGGKTSNIINEISPGSTWFQIEPGETVFAYEVEDGEEWLSVTFHHNDLYGGV